MPLPVQTKLLRVLQESVVERIGGTKPIPIDIRVICATNKNIEQMVEDVPRGFVLSAEHYPH